MCSKTEKNIYNFWSVWFKIGKTLFTVYLCQKSNLSKGADLCVWFFFYVEIKLFIL